MGLLLGLDDVGFGRGELLRNLHQVAARVAANDTMPAADASGDLCHLLA